MESGPGLSTARIPWRPSPRARRRAAAVAAALSAAYAIAQGVGALPPVRAWARLRAEEALRARLGEVALGEVGIDPLFRVVAGPLALGGDAGRPAIAIERARLRADLLSILSGRPELASIRLSGVRADATRPAALAALLAGRRAPPSASGAARAAPHDWPRVHVRGLHVAAALRGLPVEVGPVDLDVVPRDGGARGVRLEARLPEGGRIALDVERGATLDVHLRASGLRPGALGSAVVALPVRLADGQGEVVLDATLASDLSRGEGTARASASGLELESERLAHEPVGPFRVAAEGRLAWNRAEGVLALRDGTLTLGDRALGASLDAEVRRAEPGSTGGPRFSLTVSARRVPFAAFAAALPPSLGPPTAAPRPPADLDANLALAGPLLSPGEWTFQASLDLARMRAAARKDPPVALRSPFTFEPEDGPPFVVGPENPDFVPIDDLPDHVVRAVTTAEDAGFFGHQGFDFDELGIALAEGLEAGRVVRGGSTITQQLAKNLFLTRDRVLARKVREALAAVALEATVPKPRLLEIYLNVAEWGPGLHGIGPAARHWFGKDARQLSVKEAAFLASVIPNPVRYDAMRARGAMTDAWEQRVSEILLHMNDHGVIDEDVLVRALAEPLAFARTPEEAGEDPGGADAGPAAGPEPAGAPSEPGH